MVHHKKLQCGLSQIQYSLLHASQSAVCCHNNPHVRCPLNTLLQSIRIQQLTNLSIYYTVILGFNIHSCFITPEERDEILEQREERRIEKEFEDEIIKSPGMIPMTPGSMPQGPGMVPRTPGIPPMAVGGGISPFAPRTLAFNRLGNGSTASDLPLRDNRAHQSQYPSPQSHEVSPESATTTSPMYFPPPPKKATRA